MLTQSDHYDAVVMGGGPAGATTAALLADAGRSVVLIEKRSPQEFKIGESLMPGTYASFERLGVLEQLEQSRFPKKYSVQFYGKSGKASAPFYFFEDDPHPRSVTWQVLRSEFDELLRCRAAECGAEIHNGVTIKDVVFEGDRATEVEIARGDGERERIGARVVVDATGQSTLLSRKLKLRQIDPHLRQASIFTHYVGGYRDPGIDEGATLILHTEDGKAWFWYIPMPEDRVSVGVVAPVDYLISSRTATPEEIFLEEVENCAEVKRRLQDAIPVMDVAVLRDFSYSSKQIAGAGWVLVGDAYSFIDPVYSSGILLALKSGEMAADAILEGLENDDLSAATLGRFAPVLKKGMDSVRRLVRAFYSENFSFGTFLGRYPEHQRDIVDILIGQVFDREFDDLFEHMGEMFDLPEA